MIFAQDICDKEGACKENVTQGHLNTEGIYKEENLDIGQDGCEYAESKQSGFTEEPVEGYSTTIDNDE